MMDNVALYSMRKTLFIILFFTQFLFSKEIIDAKNITDIQLLLDYNSIARDIDNKADKAEFYSDISFILYTTTLNLQDETKDILSQYTVLINDLEKRLNIENTAISYSLGAPIIESHFKPISINRQTLKNNSHDKQAELMRGQYFRLLRYSEKIIAVCDERIDELLTLLDETSIDRLYNGDDLDKHIVVMNFSNLSNDKKYDKFISTFSDIIINRYKNRDDISVMYSGSIEPDLRNIIDGGSNTRLLIDGSFLIDGYDININFKVYDVSDWSLKINESLSCDIRDINCVYDNFLWHIKNSVDPLIFNKVYDDFSNDEKKIIKKEDLDKSMISDKDDNLFSVLLEDFVVQQDYSFDINYRDIGIGNDSDSKSQTFDLSNYPGGVQNKQDLSNSLVNILYDFLLKPYKISIDKLEMAPNEYDNNYIDLLIPVSYSIKRSDLKKLIKKFPYNTLDSRDDIYIIEFLYHDYLFERKTIKSLSQNKDELFPVLFFTNRDGNIQKIIIDSWDTKYDHLLFGEYDVSRINSFSPLFSVIQSDKNMNLNITKKKQDITYKVTMPVSVLDNYTRMTVKLFTRAQLDSYLPISELKF